MMLLAACLVVQLMQFVAYLVCGGRTHLQFNPIPRAVDSFITCFLAAMYPRVEESLKAWAFMILSMLAVQPY